MYLHEYIHIDVIFVPCILSNIHTDNFITAGRSTRIQAFPGPDRPAPFAPEPGEAYTGVMGKTEDGRRDGQTPARTHGDPAEATAVAARLNARGIDLTTAGKYDEAVDLFTRAIALDPDNPGLRYNRGEALRRAGRNHEARVDLQAALAAEGESPGLLLALGLVAYESDDYALAISDYRRAIELDPSFAEAWNNLGVVEFRSGMYGPARENFAKAVKLNPDYAEAWYNLADACDELGLAAERRKALAELSRLGGNGVSGDEDDDGR